MNNVSGPVGVVKSVGKLMKQQNPVECIIF